MNLLAKARQLVSQGKAEWGRLSLREKRLVLTLGGVGSAMVGLIVLYFVWSGFSKIDEWNASCREALRKLVENREAFLEAKSRMASQEVRVSRTPLELSSLVEAAAKEAGIEIAETTERAPAQRGKRYVEKGIDLKLRNVDLQHITAFLKRIETGTQLLLTDRLYLKTRYNEHDKFDIVEVGVLTFEHGSLKGKEGNKRKRAGDGNEGDES